MSQHIIPVRTNLVVFAALMALLVLTVAVSYMGLGAWETPVALAIAIAKAVLIMMYFMHLKFSTKLIWLYAGASTLWLVILIAFGLSDFLTRNSAASPVIPRSAYFGREPGQVDYPSAVGRIRTIDGDRPAPDVEQSH